MRYEDQQLIREYCRLGLAIAAAKNPGTKHDVSEADTLKRGYLMLKARMEQLAPKKRGAFRAMLQDEIHAVKELITKAKASGEDFSLADIEIEMVDLASGEAIPDKPNVTIETANDNQQEQASDSATDDERHPSNPEQTEAHAQAGGSDDGHQGAGGDRQDP